MGKFLLRSMEIKINGFLPNEVIFVKTISHVLRLGDDVLQKGSANINYAAMH